MTYIQNTHSKNRLNFIIAGMIFASLVGIFLLVGLYNNIVNLNHTIAAVKTQLDSIGAQNANLNQQVVAAIGNIQSGDLASADGLVTDNHPQYVAAGQAAFSQQPLASNQQPAWPIASQ